MKKVIESSEVDEKFNSSNGKHMPLTVKCLSKNPVRTLCQNVFINMPLNQFCPLSLPSISSCFLRPPKKNKILSCIPKPYEEAKVKHVRDRLSVGVEFGLTVKKRQLRLRRLSRGFSSYGDASW